MKTRFYYWIYNITDNTVMQLRKNPIYYDREKCAKDFEYISKKLPEKRFMLEVKTETYDDTKVLKKEEEKKWENLDTPVKKLPATNNQYPDK